MHFRHVLITCILVGAAFLLPEQTLAEKNKTNGQQKAEQVITPEKTVAVPKRALQNKGQVKQQIAKSPPQQAVIQKQTAMSRKLPNQANGNGPSLVKKTKKAVNKAKTKAKEKTKRLGNNKHHAKKVGFESLDNADLEIKNEPAIASKFEPQEEGSHLSLAKQKEKSIPNSEKRKSPASKEPIPAVNQGTSPTQRTGTSPGPSNDRISIGLNTIGSIDKWFEWNNHYKLKHVQPFFSRYILMSNQWVNAPPSPPPKEAPFLKA